MNGEIQGGPLALLSLGLQQLYLYPSSEGKSEESWGWVQGRLNRAQRDLQVFEWVA